MPRQPAPVDIPSSAWTLTPEGNVLIVDCSECGEIGAVPAATKRGDDEYGRAAALFLAHACAR